MNAAQLALTGELAEAVDDADARALLALPVGLHENVPESVYHSRPLNVASKSGLDELRRSPAHFYAWARGERERSSPALELGKALHRAVLEPERFAREASEIGARPRTTRARVADELALAGMVAALARHPLVPALLDGARTEVTARWRDVVECKARADIANGEILVLADLKTTDDASRDGFARSVWNYGYHRQADFYLRAWRACGVPIEHFVFVAVEKRPPHVIGLYELDDAALNRGREENDVLLARLRRCLEEGRWPGLPESIEPLSLPRWA